MMDWKHFIQGAIIAVAIVAVVAGVVWGFVKLDEASTPDYDARQETELGRATKVCEQYGGVGYLNMDNENRIDELRCKEGALVEH